MRRVIINGKYLSQKTTGVQRVAHALVSGLVAAKQNSSANDSAPELVLAEPAGVKNPYDGLKQRAGHLKGVPWEQLELPAVAGRDVLLSLCNMAPLARRGDVLMIHDAQAFISPDSYSKAFGLWYRTMLPMLAGNASKLLTVSHYAKSCLEDAGVASSDRFEVIHNGVDHVLSIVPDTTILTELDLVGRDYIVGLSSTQHHKNVKTIVDAARLMKHRSAPLVLIGAATVSDFEAAGIAIPDNVILAGRLNDAQMRATIEGARAFAFSSLTEGFGLPPLEAMLLGTPAIIAPCGALPEVCGDAALTASATDKEAWADAFDKILEDNAIRAHYSAVGQVRAAEFKWTRATQQLARVLREAA